MQAGAGLPAAISFCSTRSRTTGGSRVDGALATLVRANGLFRGVHLASGQHTVEFTYRPRGFLLGAAVSAVALVTILGLCLAARSSAAGAVERSVKGEAMSTAKELREQIASLVRRYHQEQFSNHAFNPETDLVHYAGRVFDADELCSLVDCQPRLLPDGQSLRRAIRGRVRRLPGPVGRAPRQLRIVGQPGRAHALDVAEARRSPASCPATKSSPSRRHFPRRSRRFCRTTSCRSSWTSTSDDYTADADQLREAIGPRTRAIMMAHTLGVPFDLDAVTRPSRRSTTSGSSRTTATRSARAIAAG